VYDHVLVPTDDAGEMNDVFRHAAEIARPHDATIHAVHVVDKRAFLTLDDELVDDVERQLQDRGERATERATDWFEKSGLDVETANVSGDPVDEILRYATETGADLIVMGTRRREDGRGMLGSVSQKVTNRADVPVLVVDIADEG
jgi:nucleotide-binding universal stress UspA family protein